MSRNKGKRVARRSTMWVGEQWKGLRPVETRALTGPVNTGAQGKLGFQFGVCAVKSQKWTDLGLKTGSRRDVRGHVAA